MNKPIVTIGSVIALALALVPAQTQRSADEAHSFLFLKDRWAVKTGADVAASRLRTDPPQITTVAKLIHLERPKELPENAAPRDAQINRYGDTEQTVFSIDADIVRYKLQTDDHEIQLVIRDHADFKAEEAAPESGQRRTMLVKIPDPVDVVKSSPWRSAIVTAHRDFTRLFHPTSSFTSRVLHVRITGVGFFDTLHAQSGAAPNGMELHPVLKLEILDKQAGDAPKSSAAAPAQNK